MSRTQKKKPVPSGENPADYRMVGQVILLDTSEAAAYLPPADVHETSEGVIIRMELPGVPAANMEVWVRGPRIEVTGEKQADPVGEDASYMCLERCFGKFHRAFDVSGSVNLFRMTAVLRNGVLMLAIPKCAERRGREWRIAVREEES